MITDINSNSYATISFSNDSGIPVDKHNTDEYYVLGPKNNGSKSDIFIGINNHLEEQVFLPNTEAVLGGGNLSFIILYSTIIMFFLCTLCRVDLKMSGKENGENDDQ